ncbi:hypothetical protein A8C72_13955 [Escherichia coli]|nr:hypothetical protein A8C72_13955 [Escherichia coli]
MLGGESMKEKKAAVSFDITAIFLLVMQVVIQGGTKLRHIRPRNDLQGFTCFDVVGRVSAVLMG